MAESKEVCEAMDRCTMEIGVICHIVEHVAIYPNKMDEETEDAMADAIIDVFRHMVEHPASKSEGTNKYRTNKEVTRMLNTEELLHVMGKEKRFYYSKSPVYGWCVYDRQIQMPAYMACAEYLPPVRQDENGTVMESPILLETEYQAMKLCARLNVAYKRDLLGK